MNGKEDSALLDVSFISLRLVLGNAESDQGSHETANGSADAYAGERGHDGASRDERAYTGNRERADSRQNAQSPADCAAGQNAGGGAFGGLGVLLVREFFRSLIIRKQNRDIVI